MVKLPFTSSNFQPAKKNLARYVSLIVEMTSKFLMQAVDEYAAAQKNSSSEKIGTTECSDWRWWQNRHVKAQQLQQLLAKQTHITKSRAKISSSNKLGVELRRARAPFSNSAISLLQSGSGSDDNMEQYGAPAKPRTSMLCRKPD